MRGRGLFILAFLTPAVSIYGLFVAWPLLQAFAFSAYRWRGVSMRRTYVGFENYSKLAGDEVFRKAVQNNLTLLLVGGIFILALSLLVAHGLQIRSRMATFVRSIVLFPQMTSLVVVAVLWMFIFNPQYGLLTSFLKAVGLSGWVHTWLGESRTALGSVGVAFVWYALGFYVLLFSAGLKSLPAEVGEACSLDGATGWRRFWRVTWPMLWSVKRIAIVHLAITVVNIFTLVFLMTNGGPDRATETMLTYLYENAFANHSVGYATAIAVANFVLVMGLSLAILTAFRRDPSEARA